MQEFFKSLKQRLLSFILVFKEGFLEDASKLISGTIVAQLVIILTAPIITRLYTPSDLGILAIFTAIIAIMGSLSTLRYEIAIPLAKNDQDSTSIISLSIIVNVIYTSVCCIFLYFFGKPVLNSLNAGIMLDFLWLIPVGIFISGLIKTFTYWALKKEAFTTVAYTRVQQGAGMSVSQIIFGLLNFSSFGLVLGYVVGFVSGLTKLIFFWFKTGLQNISSITPKTMSKVAKEHKDLPLFSNWGGLINVIGLQIPVIFFASLFSPYLAGFYMLAQRVANAPVQLVAEAFGKVFYIAAIKQSRDNKVEPLAKTTFRFLIRISLLPFLILTIIAPQLFSIVFGLEWSDAGIYLQYMAIWLLSSFVFVPLMTLFAALDKHRADLFFQVNLVIVRVIGICIGALLNSPIIAIASFSLLSALVYIAFGTWLLNLSGISYLKQLKIFVSELKIPSITISILLLLRFFVLNDQTPSIINMEFIIFIIISFLMVLINILNAKPLLIKLKNYSS